MGGMVGWGLHCHFHVQPNYSVKVVLCCHWDCDNINARGPARESALQLVAI